MTDELFPCDHCGGAWAFGFSQRLLNRPSAPERDYSQCWAEPCARYERPRSAIAFRGAVRESLLHLLRRVRDANPLDSRQATTGTPRSTRLARSGTPVCGDPRRKKVTSSNSSGRK